MIFLCAYNYLLSHNTFPMRSIHSESLQQRYKTPAIKAMARIRNNIFTHFGTSRSAPSLFAWSPNSIVKNSAMISIRISIVCSSCEFSALIQYTVCQRIFKLQNFHSAGKTLILKFQAGFSISAVVNNCGLWYITQAVIGTV